ncbi:hypothetical protein LINPERPRIM_LOCUS3622, partial [Linum perenne]
MGKRLALIPNRGVRPLERFAEILQRIHQQIFSRQTFTDRNSESQALERKPEKVTIEIE